MITCTSGRAVRTTGAAVEAAGAVSPVGAGADTVAGGAMVAGVAGIGVLGGGGGGVPSADPSVTAAAMPIEATMPNIVETPIPAAAIRAR